MVEIRGKQACWIIKTVKRKPMQGCVKKINYRIAGKFGGGFGESTRFEHLAKEGLAN